ncbi:Protein of unknown function, partial [Cotesia congregata]
DPETRLDVELTKILNETSVDTNTHDKVKQYSELLRRYLFFKNQHRENNSTIEKIENNEVIPDTNDFSAINGNQEISSIAINNSIAEQNKSYKVSDIEIHKIFYPSRTILRKTVAIKNTYIKIHLNDFACR